jgi:DNA-binding transcriptional LysR family regulator
VELSHLRYFFHVATARSFVRGARAAFVTPPALSKAIRGLEDELGVALLERSTRHVRLTRAGELVLDRCRQILEQAESLRRDAATASREVKGELRIAAMEVFSIDLLPVALTRLVRAHPGVVPLVYEMGPEDMLRSLDHGLLDVGFSIGGQPTAAVARDVLGRSPACIVSGPDHPLHRSKRVSPSELARQSWVVPRFFGRPPFPALDQFPDEKYPRTLGATIELMQAGIRLASGGSYLGCFPEISIRRELREGTLLPFRGAPRVPPFELAVFTRRNTTPSPAVEALVRRMRDVLAERPQPAVARGARARRLSPAS